MSDERLSSPWNSRTLKSGARLLVPPPVPVEADFVFVDPDEPDAIASRNTVINQCMAAFDTRDGQPPLNVQLVGPAGVGKNTIAKHLATLLNRDLFVLVANQDMTTEDMVATAVVRADSKIEYVASPLLAGILNGGLILLDEIAKARPKAMAPLSSLLENERRLHSDLLGETFHAHPNTLFMAAWNPDDEDSYALPEWLNRRLLPRFELRPPSFEVLMKIVVTHLHRQLARPDGAEPVARAVVDALRQRGDLAPSPGRVVRLALFASRLQALLKCLPGEAVAAAVSRVYGVPANDPAVEP